MLILELIKHNTTHTNDVQQTCNYSNKSLARSYCIYWMLPVQTKHNILHLCSTRILCCLHVQVFCLLNLLVGADTFIPPRFKTTDCTGYEMSGFWNLRHYRLHFPETKPAHSIV
jgi:hypothetical protein